MNTVGFIRKDGETSYFYIRIGQKLRVIEHSGPDMYVRKLMVDNKASSILILFETFLQLDKEIVDRGKGVQVYEELAKRIQAYIEWGHENRVNAPESVIQNGFIATKYMNGMINMISMEHPMRKHLIFLEHSVTQTYHAPYNIEE
jgi:hypothetical protein